MDFSTVLHLACPPERVRLLLSDPAAWPPGSLPFCDHGIVAEEGGWRVRSLTGEGRLELDPGPGEMQYRYRFRFNEGEWQLRFELRPRGENAEIAVAMPKPHFCDRALYEDYIELAQRHLNRLKKALDR